MVRYGALQLSFKRLKDSSLPVFNHFSAGNDPLGCISGVVSSSHHDFVSHAISMGKFQPLSKIAACDTSRYRQFNGCTCTSCDVGIFHLAQPVLDC